MGGVLELSLRKGRLAGALEMRVAELHENGVTCRLEGSMDGLRLSAIVSLSELSHVPYLGESVLVRVLHS